MFGLFDWLKLGAGALAGACLAWAVAYPLAYSRGNDAGREAERAAARERAMELIEKRNQDNAEISDMDLAALCAELGGRWVQSDCVD